MPTLYDYQQSLHVSVCDYSFYSLPFALIRGADAINLVALEVAFPKVVYELRHRHDAPKGILLGEASE